MGTKQTVIWTALPNGWVKGASTPTLALSVFVSARLETTEGLPRPTLSQFPDFLEWTKKAKDITFTVQLGNASPISANRVGPALEPDLWIALCKDSTYVKPYQPPQTGDRNIRSVPVGNLDQFLKNQYKSIITASPTALPSRDTVLEKLSPTILHESAGPSAVLAAPMTATKAEAPTSARTQVKATAAPTMTMTQAAVHPQARELRTFAQTTSPRVQKTAERDLSVLLEIPERNLKPQTVEAYKRVIQDLGKFRAVPPAAPQPTRDYLQLTLFHQRGKVAKPALQIPEIDFHQFLSSLGSYPQLMKRLGLVVDLEIPVPGGISNAGTVRVLPSWTPALSASSDFTPKTAFVADQGASRFIAAPGPDADFANGLLKLNDQTKTPVITYDVDGAAMKTATLAEQLQTEKMGSAASTSLPAVQHPGSSSPATSQFRMAPAAASGSQQTAQPDAKIRSSAIVMDIEQTEPPLTMLRSAPARASEVAPVPITATLPTLRSAGFSVARTGQAYMLAKAQERVAMYNKAVEQNKPEDVTFHSEDLVRGYRVDIWDSDSLGWHSLCKRKGTYRFLNGDLTREYEDEGFIQLAVTQNPGETPDELPSDLYLHESIFRWDGWSLSASRPGKTVGPKGKPDNYNDPSKAADKAQTQFKLVTSFKAVSHSLPRLRFGTTYRVRARVVDLAGNSLALEDVSANDFSQATAAHVYTRFEPVVAPLAALVKSMAGDKGPGESLEHLVIRSNFDKSALEYVARFAELTDNPSYTATTERLLVPPKTSQLMAERHRMFDAPSGGMKKDKDTFEIIIKLSEASMPSDPASKSPLQESLAIPYMPDPLARGAYLHLLDRHGSHLANPLAISFYKPESGWPSATGFRIRLLETNESTNWTWSDGERLLTINLPKAQLAILKVSSHLGEGEIGMQNLQALGLWQWAEDAKPGNLSQMQDAAGKSQVWMLTPQRDLTLLHAVQQPLTAPQFHALTASRILGATYAYIGDDLPMPIDGKSTIKVDIEAAWKEPIDDISKAGPEVISGQAHVFEFSISPDDNDIAQTLEPVFRREIDHHIRKMTVIHASRVAGSALRRSAIIAAPAGATREQKRSSVVVAPAPAQQQAISAQAQPQGQFVKAAPEIVAPALPTKQGYSFRHDLSDTKYRKVAYRAIATTRFREYFPLRPPGQPAAEPIPVTRESSAVEVDVPNSARPAAPTVLYVIPTFGWERQTNVDFNKNARSGPAAGLDFDGLGVVSKRLGGGLRIYLDRPWYSSGDGELLGVLMWVPPVGRTASTLQTAARALISPGGAATVPEQLRPYATQWGVDPIWASNATSDVPSLQNFKRAVKNQEGLTVEELPGDWKVAVAGHAVEYDTERQLWYCDLEIDAGPSYYPFVRLALARYQPISIPNAHLSRVVRADFAQLPPDRTAAVVFDRKDPRKVYVAVSGEVFAVTGQAVTRFQEVEVSVEAQGPGGQGDVGWTPVPNGTARLKAKAGGSSVVWSEELRLPRAPGVQPFRVVIREYELFDSDKGQGAQRARRLVYADAVELGGLKF